MRRSVIFSLLPLLAACAATPENHNMPMTELARGAYSQLTVERMQVIRDAGTLAELWSQAQVRDPVPPIDFEEQMVVLAALGERRTGGYRVDILRVAETETGLVVHVQVSTPGRGCMVTQALTQPYHFVAVPASDAPVDFEVSHQRVSCGG